MNEHRPRVQASGAPVSAVAEMSKILLGDQSLDELLDRLAHLAKASVARAEEVSITLVQDGKAKTAGFTGDLAIQLDERQYDIGYGPCLDAAFTGRTIMIADTAGENHYDSFAREARRRGILATLSVGLPIPQRTVGAMNLYAVTDSAFDTSDVEAVQDFAGYAAVAVANAALYAGTERLAGQMQQAMESRAVIEQAKGILMRDNRCSPDQAFDMLRLASNRSNRKLNELARSIVENTERGG